jgi:transcription initiation factor IIE alpha subunit
VISPQHQEAAFELWRYSERSVECIFGDSTGNPMADKIYAAIVKRGPMTRSDISGLFHGHAKTQEITDALQHLERTGLASCERTKTSGRDTEVWTASVKDSR